jgi:hypothetical protein
MAAFLKKELETGGFVVNEVISDVIVVEDFLSQDDLNVLNNIINNLQEEDWMIEYTKNLTRFCLEKFGRDDVDNLVAEGKFEITQGWQDKNYNLESESIAYKVINKLNYFVKLADESLEASGLKTLQRMQEGVELKAHTDQHTDPSIRYATIIYLNDNYSGGQLFFSNKDLELKPKPGSLVIFPGTDEFNHGVRHVKPGSIRYVLVGFIKVKDFYKNNKY